MYDKLHNKNANTKAKYHIVSYNMSLSNSGNKDDSSLVKIHRKEIELHLVIEKIFFVQ